MFYESEVYEKLAEILPEERIRTDEPMKMHTTFRVGGPADYFLMPESPEEVQELVRLCKKEEVPFYVIGNGSNLLVSDQGYRGVILQIYRNMSQIRVEGNVLRAQAGALLSAIAARAYENSLTGFEFRGGNTGNDRRRKCNERRSLWRRDERRAPEGDGTFRRRRDL